MKQKTVFPALFLGLCTMAACASTISVNYATGDSETNFCYEANPGDLLKITEKIPADMLLSKLGVSQDWGEISRTTINVGVNKFKNNWARALQGCVTDARHMSKLFNYGKGENPVLTDDQAAKANVRSKIQQAAQSLTNGCECVISFATHGSEVPPVICLYDETYAAEELAEDLALFCDGVKVAVLLDVCHASAIVPGQKFAFATLEALKKIRQSKQGNAFSSVDPAKDVVFLVATWAEQFAGDIGVMGGVFSNSLYYFGQGRLADADGDGRITFKELYDTSIYVQTAFKSIKRQTPVITNPELAEKFMATPIQDQDSIGELAISEDGASFEYSLHVPKADVKINIKAEEPELGKNVMLLTSYNMSLKPGKQPETYVIREKSAFILGDCAESLIKPDMTGFLYLNNRRHKAPTIADPANIKITANGYKEKCLIPDPDQEVQAGKCLFKGNVKKNATTIKRSIKVPCDGEYSIKKETGFQEIRHFTRINGHIFNSLATASVVYDPVKGLKARLAKNAPPKSQAE